MLIFSLLSIFFCVSFDLAHSIGIINFTNSIFFTAKSQPFRIEWLADSIDYAAASTGGAVKGFSLKYWQVSC